MENNNNESEHVYKDDKLYLKKTSIHKQVLSILNLLLNMIS